MAQGMRLGFSGGSFLQGLPVLKWELTDLKRTIGGWERTAPLRDPLFVAPGQGDVECQVYHFQRRSKISQSKNKREREDYIRGRRMIHWWEDEKSPFS